jgi:hypothetical protein
MPLVGGGGSPNVAGSNPAGTGTSLNIVGDHIFGNNNLTANNASITMFNHTNGAYYAVISIAAGRNMKSSAEITTIAELDGENCYEAKFDNGITSTLTMPFGTPFEMIIPPYANFQLKFEVNDAEDTIGCTIQGRIYA